jgi:phage terminase large subunit-like protein
MTLTRQQTIEAIKLLEQKQERINNTLYIHVYKSFYDWQREFVEATKNYFECCLCAANQIGKTYTGTDIDAMHLLGDYPDDWPGFKFEFAPMCWGLGYSMEKTRDLLQSALFGKYLNGSFSGGLIPKDRIVSWESAGGTANAMRSVSVKHKLGTSTIQFWSYSQGQHAIMGDVVDWVHIDEEPKDQNIRPQVLTRTANGDRGKGGRIIYTFTPENGRTELVIKFMDEPTKDQFFMMKGWADAPHMTPEKQERMLAQYPAHQRDMRTKGIPMLGHGRIFDFSEEFITCDSFEIPKHWFVINGMDFGWDHPQAQVQLVWNKDEDEYYVTRAWKKSQTLPALAYDAVKTWAKDTPTAWPADGLQTEKGSAKQQKSYYQEAGFKMLPKHATWSDGSNGVEAGLFEIRDQMQKGKFKVFSGLREWFAEFNQYHRDENGKIAKVSDDLLDATRYAYMMRRHAVNVGSVGKDDRIDIKQLHIPTVNHW